MSKNETLSKLQKEALNKLEFIFDNGEIQHKEIMSRILEIVPESFVYKHKVLHGNGMRSEVIGVKGAKNIFELRWWHVQLSYDVFNE